MEGMAKVLGNILKFGNIDNTRSCGETADVNISDDFGVDSLLDGSFWHEFLRLLASKKFHINDETNNDDHFEKNSLKNHEF